MHSRRHVGETAQQRDRWIAPLPLGRRHPDPRIRSRGAGTAAVAVAVWYSTRHGNERLDTMHRAPEVARAWPLVFYPPNAGFLTQGCPLGWSGPTPSTGSTGVLVSRAEYTSVGFSRLRGPFPTRSIPRAHFRPRTQGSPASWSDGSNDRRNGDVPGGLRQKHPASLLRHWRSSSVDDDNIDRLSQFSGLLFLGELMSERKSGPAQCGRRKGCARR